MPSRGVSFIRSQSLFIKGLASALSPTLFASYPPLVGIQSRCMVKTRISQCFLRKKFSRLVFMYFTVPNGINLNTTVPPTPQPKEEDSVRVRGIPRFRNDDETCSAAFLRPDRELQDQGDCARDVAHRRLQVQPGQRRKHAAVLPGGRVIMAGET